MKHKIDTWVGIHVCVGIAPSKTLAKLANHAAKKYKGTKGVVDLTNRERQRRLMALVEVGDVWGGGRRISEKLIAMGIKTALDLADADPKSIRLKFSVVVERIVRELNGISCIDLEEAAPTKKQIICSRSFGERILEKRLMREAICKYVTRAAEKLRGEKRLTKSVSVFIRTSPFSKGEPHYSNSMATELPNPTDDTRDLLEVAEVLLDRIWRPGHRYAKAGVILMDFYEQGTYQGDMFRPHEGKKKSKELMCVVDRINHSGLGNVFFAAQGVTPQWSMKREHLSPAYTTRWSDLKVVR